MLSTKQLSRLPLPIPGLQKPDPEDERIVGLFRNRAELKKAYSSLQHELQSWKDRVKQQEGALARAQEYLRGLEERLSRADTGPPTLVFYQLRELWTHGHSLIESFGGELVARREAQEKEAHRHAVAQEMARCRAAFDAPIAAIQARAVAAGAAVDQVRGELGRCAAWWYYFRRRKLTVRLNQCTAEAVAAYAELDAERARAEAAAQQAVVPFSGLSTGARRSINATLIAYAHALHDRLAVSNVFDLACKAVRLREAPDGVYGDRDACDALIGEVQLVRATLQQPLAMKSELAAAALKLKPLLAYTGEDNPVPDAETLVGTPDNPGTRVLKDNTWQVNRLLLR